MLRQMRDGAKQGWLKFILLGFMALAVGGLVLTDVGGFFRGGIGNNVVAKGKNIEIGIQEFDQSLRRILANQQMGPQEAYQMGLVDQALRSEIQNRIISLEAQKIGIRPNDETVARQIRRMAADVPTNGGSKRDALVQILRSQGVSENEFIAAVRQELGNDLLQNALASNLQELPLGEAKALYQYQNEKRDFNGFILSQNNIKSVEKPTEDNLKKFYESRKISYAIPETRDITIATLKKEMVAKDLKIEEDEVRAAYDDNIEGYKKPEQRTLQQAIVKDQKQAQEIIDAANADKSTLEKAVLKITSNTTAYLGENDFSEEGLTDVIATPVFKAEKGTIVGPTQTPLGWHVVKVENIVAPSTVAYEKVKDRIKDDMMQNRLVDDLIEAANRFDDQLAGGEELETIVTEMGLTTEKIKELSLTGLSNGKDALKIYEGDKAQILENAFDFEAGETSPVFELADGRYIAVRVNGIRPLSYTPFADIKSDLEKQWMRDQKMLANQDRAEKAFADLNAGETLTDVAKKYGANVKNYKNLERSKANNADITLPSLREIFKATQDTPLKSQGLDSFLIGKVTAINLPDTKDADNKIKEIQDQNNNYVAQEFMGQYMMALLDKYKVRINEKLLEQAYGAQPDQ